MYVSSSFFVQMGKILSNQEINSYYKGYPMFENLIELRLFWFHHGTRDLIWDDVVKMLQNCPKLQALSITKVWLSSMDSYCFLFFFFFSIQLFLQIIFCLYFDNIFILLFPGPFWIVFYACGTLKLHWVLVKPQLNAWKTFGNETFKN